MEDAKATFTLPIIIGFLAILGLTMTILGLTLLKNTPAFAKQKPTQSRHPSANSTTTQNSLTLKPNAAPATASPMIKTTHIAPPKDIKGIYMTSWVAGIPTMRNKLITFVNDSEINAVVIDIKDYSGYISFKTHNPEIEKWGTEENRISDVQTLINTLHQNGIYVIGRISVFQDPLFAKKNPHLSVQTPSGQIWRDRNNLAYIDPSAKPYWDYIVTLAKTSYQLGFDEINFDYIRFPTDGNLSNMVFPLSGQLPQHARRYPTGNVKTKATILASFYSYLHQQLGPIPTSADLFGMVLTQEDDLNIGQILEIAAPYFSYICPMIYPSHYPPHFNKFSNPAEHPYEIVNMVLTSGKKRMDKINQPGKLRPWLQDFKLGAVYDKPKIKAQIRAANDAGIYSWLMWDPRNIYTKDAYAKDGPINAIPKAESTN